jgi:hypothetical protein
MFLVAVGRMLSRLMLLSWLVLAAALACAPIIALAAPTPEKEDPQVEVAKENVNFLREQTKSLIENGQKSQEHFYNKLMILLAVVTLVYGFIFWQTKRDLKQDLEERYLDAEKKLKDKYFQEFGQMVDQQLSKEKATLRKLIRQQQAYQNARVLVMGTESDLKEIKKETRLNRFDKKPTFLPYTMEQLRWEIEQDSFDVFVYRYATSVEKDPSALEIVNFLNEINREIPCVIWTDGQRLSEGGEILSGYKWINIANSPTALAERLFILTALVQK